MARVRFDVNKATNELRREINKVLKEPELEKEIGIFLTERVRFRARVGKPLNNSGSFPKLKDLTIAVRGYLARFNGTHPSFEKSKSNLTLTGQLQNAISFERISGGVFQLFVKDSKRTPYKTGGKGSSKALTNEEVYGHLRKNGFILFTAKGLKSDKNIPKRIKAFLLRYLRRQLRRS